MSVYRCDSPIGKFIVLDNTEISSALPVVLGNINQRLFVQPIFIVVQTVSKNLPSKSTIPLLINQSLVSAYVAADKTVAVIDESP